MILAAVSEARQAGARLSRCARVVGIDARTLQRWRCHPDGEDARKGPVTSPHNRLSDAERQEVLALVTSEEYRDLSPNQIVPKLADLGRYVASESTMYRLLRAAKLDAHRGKARPRRLMKPEALLAAGPNEVWSWDITYLRSPVRGSFFYLYLIVDVWSRKVVGWRVHERECSELAAELVTRALRDEDANPHLLALHQDNGGPMKGATLKATLEALGVLASYSRPRVSDDNPFSESLFRTLKYRPEYPTKPFESLDDARRWVSKFVSWYNEGHLHSGISFVTPTQRHTGRDCGTLRARKRVYEAARLRHPERWSGASRAWSRQEVVALNPAKQTKLSHVTSAHAA